jgi:hypothetical protein
MPYGVGTMRMLMAVALGVICMTTVTYGYEGRRADSVLLNGAWEFALGNGDERAETAAGAAKLAWRPARLPGVFVPWTEENATTVRFAWARRRFEVTPVQARRLAVLRWNQIDFGAIAFINGRKVGENEPTGPYQVMLPVGALKAGENEIVLRIPGAAGVRKGKSGKMLIPAGFASQNPRGIPAVHDDVWIDFADGAYVKWALAVPDVAGSRVTFRVTPAAPQSVEALRVAVEVVSWPDGAPAGTGEAPAGADPSGGRHSFVTVAMPGFRAWTYEQPNLYTATVRLFQGKTALDEVSFRFGMREIKTEGGRYTLNGRPLWLRGSDLVGEWTWGDHWVVQNEKTYLVDEAREMSMNSFRTHTIPPPAKWADICDEYGTMILAEFRDLHNGTDFEFTPEEYETFHRNCLSDAAGWMARLWNHPAVITWVLSNESYSENEWEAGPYRDLVRALDPTRPTMRTDNETAEIFDVHTCGNTVDTCEGLPQTQIASWFGRAHGRVVTNTEYMNIFDRPITQWTGTDDKEADAIAYAQLGLEHTEAMRRARLAGLWPYMYAGWTKTRRGGQEWRAGYAQPISAALHSGLSPVLASLDLFDPDYLVGQEVTTDLYLINDSWHDATIHVDVLLTDEDPQFIPEAECLDRPRARWSHDFDLPADSLRATPITWRLPEKPGSYWLTARTRGIAGRPVLSQRFLRAVARPEAPARAKQRRIVVLGGDGAAAAYLHSKGLTVAREADRLDPGRDLVLVWDTAHLSASERESIASLGPFIASGGRVVVLATQSWDWPGLCEVTIPVREHEWDSESYLYSRAFPYADVSHPMLAGVPADGLMRWNGLPGTVAFAPLQGPAMAGATKLLWVRAPDHVVAAEVPAKAGGSILFCQLDLRGHISGDGYDPVAERVLMNVVGW